MSPSLLIQELQAKSKEVRKYCLFLKAIEAQSVKLSMGNHQTERHKLKEVDTELEKTLKATVFLLLYNLVESTVRSIIEYLYETIQNNQISFDDLNPQFQNHIVQVLRGTKLKNQDWQSGIARRIIVLAAEKEGSFAGNLDARKIRETLANYGIQMTNQGTRTPNGSDLESIKEARKDLAHGHISFSDKGRGYTSDELLAMQKRVFAYLKGVLQDVENYVNQRQYLKILDNDEDV